VAFARPAEAVAAAVQAQRALAAHPWPTRALLVRMGLHTGEVATTGGDYVGLEVHRAARIAAVAHGGQVVVSEATAILGEDALPEGTVLRDLGHHRLKDFARPIRLYQMDVAGLATEFPPLRTAGRRGRRPAHLGSFVGRQREVQAVSRLLMDDDARLVTLTGPGGIGKTRLALEVAARLEPSFNEGTVIVLLAPVRSPSLVVPTITQTLGLPETSGRSQFDVLMDYVSHCHLLLVLDNFEHVIESAPLLADVVGASTGLKVMVTSRHVLRLSGEREFQVPPLSLSEDEAVGEPGLPEAVQLFVDRARAARHDFDLTEDSAGVVAEICRRLDGLPLAIELAAARVRLMSPEAILSKLDSRLKLLTGGPRDLPERQRTLRSTIAWSYDLLDETERRLLERLAVFTGGCSLDAAEAVSQSDDLGDVFEGISSLVEKSLLQARGVVAEQPRFSMLQTVREFALERLEARGDAEPVRRQHADFFLAFAREAGPALLTREQGLWFARLGADYDNVRAAMRWSLDRGEPERVARIGGALWPFWWGQGRLLEGVEWMEESLRGEVALSTEDRASATVALGIVAFGWGDYDRAVPALEVAQDLCLEVGNWFGRGMSVALRGIIATVHGDAAAGEEAMREALETFRANDDVWGMGFARYVFGRVLLLSGRGSEARDVLEDSVVDVRRVGERQLLILALLNLGWARLTVGEVNPARESLSEALHLLIGLRYNRVDSARVLEALAAVAVALGDPLRGALLFGAAEGARRSVGAGVWIPDRPTHERTEQALRAALGPDVYIAKLAEGGRLSLEDSVELAAEL
jgi:predicted ATPase